MRVALGTFARSGIEARFGSDVGAGVEAALRHYTRRLRSRRAPIAIPPFRRDRPQSGTEAEIDLSVGSEVEEALEAEAGRQDVPVSLLSSHAVLVYLADIDAASSDGLRGSTEEDPAPPRYQRGCVFANIGPRAKARRHAGSA